MTRIYQNKYPYFVTTNTVGRDHGIFEQVEAAAIAADTIKIYCEYHQAKLFGFAIMPNHIHLLIQTSSDGKNISTIVSGIKSMIYKNIRNKMLIKDNFWQKSFFSLIKNTPELIETTIKYMKNNPRKWSLPEYYDKYPYQYFNL